MMFSGHYKQKRSLTVYNYKFLLIDDIDVFTKEVIRVGPGAVLSTLVNRFDPSLRKIANLGSYGLLVCVNELIVVQNKVYSKPTVIITNKVTEEEEIPDGVVAVLTPTMIDILSHVSIRARNSKAFQNKVYSKPTVMITNKVTEEEEIPDGVVAVLTPSMIDVLSHVSIRARNSKTCSTVCFNL
ncbi:unnamed protein product [Arabis nemorensis]|uniref:Alpha-glucan water dikinase phosphohistidine-like domain-containing protein n=1 Tax=Arabis nemorensis TaxID=586526 RepID=A0A565ASZ2_9BRAS|nr:unnamed protein product [Arabis nemorensis]